MNMLPLTEGAIWIDLRREPPSAAILRSAGERAHASGFLVSSHRAGRYLPSNIPIIAVVDDAGRMTLNDADILLYRDEPRDGRSPGSIRPSGLWVGAAQLRNSLSQSGPVAPVFGADAPVTVLDLAEVSDLDIRQIFDRIHGTRVVVSLNENQLCHLADVRQRGIGLLITPDLIQSVDLEASSKASQNDYLSFSVKRICRDRFNIVRLDVCHRIQRDDILQIAVDAGSCLLQSSPPLAPEFRLPALAADTIILGQQQGRIRAGDIRIGQSLSIMSRTGHEKRVVVGRVERANAEAAMLSVVALKGGATSNLVLGIDGSVMGADGRAVRIEDLDVGSTLIGRLIRPPPEIRNIEVGTLFLGNSEAIWTGSPGSTCDQ